MEDKQKVGFNVIRIDVLNLWLVFIGKILQKCPHHLMV
jgi:hypothetical protein